MYTTGQIHIIVTAIKTGNQNIGTDRNTDKYIDQQVDKRSVGANGGKRQTAPEIVVAKLKGQVVVDPDSVKIADMSAIGRNAAVEQFTVEVKFK